MDRRTPVTIVLRADSGTRSAETWEYKAGGIFTEFVISCEHIPSSTVETCGLSCLGYMI